MADRVEVRLQELAERWQLPAEGPQRLRTILELVDAEEPPLRVFFGRSPLSIAKADYATRIETWERWQPLSERAQG